MYYKHEYRNYLCTSVERQCVNRKFAAKRQKEKKRKREKRYNEQPTHKTAHSQAPTHKPMLQLAKEQFSCQRTRGNWYICVY